MIVITQFEGESQCTNWRAEVINRKEMASSLASKREPGEPRQCCPYVLRQVTGLEWVILP